MALICENCRHAWTKPVRHAVAPTSAGKSPLQVAKAILPTATMVDCGRAERVEALKSEFLKQRPAQDADVAAYWDQYQRVFSAEGL